MKIEFLSAMKMGNNLNRLDSATKAIKFFPGKNGNMIRDIACQRFGRWIAISRVSRKGRSFWICRCDCGEKGLVSLSELRRNKSKSCGCLSAELFVKGQTVHGMAHTSEYKAWKAMKQRCLNAKHADFKYYGARGIRVCKQWKNDFATFFTDMGARPKGYSLDRINNDGNYEPRNCRWTTPAVQSMNSRHPRIIEHNGRAQSITAWMKQLHVSHQTLSRELKHRGLPAIVESLLKRRRYVQSVC